MKKISLMLALVMVLAMLFAISVFADEVIVLGPNQVVSATAEGTTYGSPEKLFDGDTTVATGDWYRYDGKGWTGGEGAKATIVFDKEYVIQSAQLYVWSNWPGGATFEFIDAKGNSVTTANAANVSNGTPSTIAGTVGVKFQTLVITMKGNKWNGNGFQMGEIVINAIVAPECTHDMAEYMDGFKITKEATCTTPAEITYECQNCGEDVTVVPTYADVTDNSNLSSVVTNGAGGYTSGPLSLYDNDINTYLHASGGWFVESEMTLNMNYYLTSATVVVGSWYDHGSNGAYMTFYYKAPGETEWITYGTMQTPVEYKDTKYTYTFEFAEPVLASAVKIRVDGLESFGGQAFEAQVAGSVLSDGGVLKHAWVAGETVAPTCVDNGYTNYACSSCGLTKQADFVEETKEHTWADATCEAPSTCSVCGKTEGEALGHNYVPGEKAEDGSVTYTCANCNDVYVINNSAVNGEYYTSMGELVVFADGKLTAMGSEYTYTYNVTAEMITTNDDTIYFSVVEGVIYIKGAEALHQHTGEGYVAEEQEDYSVIYYCNGCGAEMYTVDNSTLNGEYYLGTDKVVFADGVLTVMDDATYTYTYKVLEGMVVTDDEAIYFSVADGVIYFKGATALHQHTGEGYVAVENEDGSTSYICNFCGEVMYVIDNAALNGTYYADLMTSFVFADGVLTANGETYNYTYNATTQELTVEGLPEGMLAVVNGKIVFRGRVELHQHNEEDLIVETTDATCTTAGKIETICLFCGPIAEEVIPAGHTQAYDWSDEETGYVGAYVYVPATCITDGYTTDKCSVCGEVFVVSTEEADPIWGHFAVEGTYVQVDATCNAAGSYSYVCEYCGETISDVIEADPSAHVYGKGALVDNKLVYTCEVCGGTEEHAAVVITVGENTVNFPQVEDEWFGTYYDSIYVIFAVPGSYTISSSDVYMDYVEARNISTWVEEFPFAFEVAEGSFAMFLVTPSNDMEQATATITIEEAGCKHTNTTEIPAVPGELRNPGMTSGVKCADCGETIVAPVQANGDFRFAAVALALGENISITYKVQVPAGFENVYVVFNMNGTETVVSDYEIEKSTGRYMFSFKGIRLQYMADLVTATVYAENGGVVSANSYSNYSVKSYIVGQLGKAANTAELKTMLSDLLILGEKTQVYQEYKLDSLMTNDVDTSLLTPSTYAGVPADEYVQQMIVNDESTRAIADWKAVALVFTDAMAVQFKLAIDPNELDKIEIKVTVPVYNGTNRVDTYTAEDLTYEESSGRYVLLVENIKASQYGQTVVGDIYYNGVQISRTVNYSVNTYIQRNQDSSNTALRDFLRAAYLYGESVFAYTY